MSKIVALILATMLFGFDASYWAWQTTKVIDKDYNVKLTFQDKTASDVMFFNWTLDKDKVIVCRIYYKNKKKDFSLEERFGRESFKMVIREDGKKNNENSYLLVTIQSYDAKSKKATFAFDFYSANGELKVGLEDK